MNFTQLVIENIIAVLGGGTLLITALSSWLGSLWSKRILMNEKTELELKIKEIEQSLKIEALRHDYQFQLSKSTYEMIFNKKINAYSELLSLKNKFT